MLKRLMHDHKHIAVLLNVLKNKQMKLSEGESINFSVVRDIVEYMQGYAERCHHPIEDIIYAYYLAHKTNDTIDKLSAEHESVIQSSATLMATLNLILSDIVVAREKLIVDFAEYVALQERHMQMELLVGVVRRPFGGMFRQDRLAIRSKILLGKGQRLFQ